MDPNPQELNERPSTDTRPEVVAKGIRTREKWAVALTLNPLNPSPKIRVTKIKKPRKFGADQRPKKKSPKKKKTRKSGRKRERKKKLRGRSARCRKQRRPRRFQSRLRFLKLPNRRMCPKIQIVRPQEPMQWILVSRSKILYLLREMLKLGTPRSKRSTTALL
jgi:hypothetical protein